MRTTHSSPRSRLVGVLLTAALALTAPGCADDGSDPLDPGADATDATATDTGAQGDSTASLDTAASDTGSDVTTQDTTLDVAVQDTAGDDTAQDTAAGDTGADTGTDTTTPDIDPFAPEPIIYAHGPDVLYSLDPDTGVIVELGPFDGCDSVIDMAVDKDANIFVTTYDGLFRVNPMTLACTLVAEGGYPNSLSFLPEGTLEPGVETLVGYFSSDYVTIDRTTGAVTTVGALSGGYASSGDIVSVKGGGTFLTVTGPDCGTTDCLFEINPVTGDVVRDWGPVGFDQVFGLAYWGGEAYGFSNGGDLFRLTFDEASTTVSAETLAFPNAPANLRFWGAGSTTIAPIIN